MLSEYPPLSRPLPTHRALLLHPRNKREVGKNVQGTEKDGFQGDI